MLLSRDSFIREMSMAVLDRLSVVHLFILWAEGEMSLPHTPTFSALCGNTATKAQPRPAASENCPAD